MSAFLEDLATQFRQRFPDNPAPLISAEPTAPTPPPSAPTPAPAPAPPAAPPVFEYRRHGVHFDATVQATQVVEAAELMDAHGFAIDTVTGIDWLAQDQMEVVYDFFHPVEPWRAAFRARIPRCQPAIATIQSIFPGANWHERETHDFLGIVFDGHPDLSPLLLPEDADYHPLRKDFAA